jgi:hypothetical protein
MRLSRIAWLTLQVCLVSFLLTYFGDAPVTAEQLERPILTIQPAAFQEVDGANRVTFLLNDKKKIWLIGTPSAVEVKELTLSPEKHAENKFSIQIELDSKGGDRMLNLSRRLIGKPLAILASGRVLMAPFVRTEIAGKFQISNLNQMSAQRLMKVMRQPPPEDVKRWLRIENETSKGVFEEYLASWPKGAFASAARKKLSALDNIRRPQSVPVNQAGQLSEPRNRYLAWVSAVLPPEAAGPTAQPQFSVRGITGASGEIEQVTEVSGYVVLVATRTKQVLRISYRVTAGGKPFAMQRDGKIIVFDEAPPIKVDGDIRVATQLLFRLRGLVLAPDRNLVGSYLYVDAAGGWTSTTKPPSGSTFIPQPTTGVMLLELLGVPTNPIAQALGKHGLRFVP